MEGSRLGEQENVSVLDPHSTKMTAWQDNGNYQMSHNTQNLVTNKLIGSTLGLWLNLKTRESLETNELEVMTRLLPQDYFNEVALYFI